METIKKIFKPLKMMNLYMTVYLFLVCFGHMAEIFARLPKQNVLLTKLFLKELLQGEE